VWADRRRESGQVAVRSRFRDGRGDMTIGDELLARTLSRASIHTIYGVLQKSLMHLRPDGDRPKSPVWSRSELDSPGQVYARLREVISPLHPRG
jgi:hypothetical protein